MKPKIVVCGLGPGDPGLITADTTKLLESGRKVFLRTARHPSVSAQLLSRSVAFDRFYEQVNSFDEVYSAIVEELVAAAQADDSTGEGIVYAVPGSPLVLERTVANLRSDQRITVELLSAVSFLDAAWQALGVDPAEQSVRVVDAYQFGAQAAGDRGPLLVAHVHDQWLLSDIKLAIDAGGEQKAIVLQRLGTAAENVEEVAWPDLDRTVKADHLTTLYIPQVLTPVAQELLQTVELMETLRSQCPWDQKQTHQSLRRHLLEETYEVIEAIDLLVAGDDGYELLEEELGDLWFQILFHCQLATEAGQFGVSDMARTVHDKLVSRHPHIFADAEVANAAEVLKNWEEIKLEEKGRESIMDGIGAALPALALAEKVLKKAASAGAPADDSEVAQIFAGFDKPLSEIDLGWFLLAVVEKARMAGVDSEAALRTAAGIARKRFVEVERAVDENRWTFG